MAVVRLEAMRMLESAIEQHVPRLRGRVVPWPQPPGQKLKLASIALILVRTHFNPEQATEVYEPSPDEVVMRVGMHELTVQMRLTAATLPERAALEEQVLDLWLSSIGRPGILLTPVVSCPRFGSITCAWELEDATWEDEMAFDEKWWTTMVVTGQVPALVTRGEAPKMRDLQLGFTTAGPGHQFSDPAVEVVRVQEDGTFVPA